MKFRARKKPASIAMINVTSLVDIVFVLLIFFAVTTSFITNSAIKVDLPKAIGEQLVEKKEVVVEIASDNGLAVVTIDGKQVFGTTELNDAFKNLEDGFVKGGAVTKDIMVVINADAKVKHGEVVKVIDTARNWNFSRFGIGVTTTAKNGE